MKKIVLALAAIVALAAPAQAQSFNFGFQSDGYGFSFGSGQQPNAWPAPRPDRPRPPDIKHCMHPYAVVELVRSQGYRNASLYDDRGRWVRVRADQRGRSYIVSVDPCRGRIVQVDPIRDFPRGGWQGGWNYGY